MAITGVAAVLAVTFTAGVFRLDFGVVSATLTRRCGSDFKVALIIDVLITMLHQGLLS